MTTYTKKSASKTTQPYWTATKFRNLLILLMALPRFSVPLINIDQSTVINQSFYNVQTKPFAEAPPMNKLDPETIQEQLELWEAATSAQRRYAEAQGTASAERLEELRQQAEFLTSAASSYHLDSMSSDKKIRH
ncbi:hypothetical protein [Pseudomonas sp. DCA-1]|uniref:hypothetical protein n=1 Tax=Pseudomonas sp. DCA-1 TaxID=3344874 RepID=UPI0039772683